MSLESLASELSGQMERHEPFELDGVPISWTARPRDAETLAATLRGASEHGLAVIPCGGGTRLALGNPPGRADLLLDTGALSGVLDFDGGEGVCWVLGGTRLGALREALAGSAWEVPLDGVDGSTVGGALAAAAVGPRSAALGLPRDVVLGLSLAHADGAQTRCGGRVVKNVTGYDLAKLYTGSLGTLGVITSAWLRLRPVPSEVQLWEFDLSVSEAAPRGLEIARRPAVRACVLSSAGEVYRCVVELAGDEPSVAQCVSTLEREHRARPAAPEVLDAVRRRQNETSDGGMRFRIAATPSRLAEVLAALMRLGVARLAYPGLALVYAMFDAEHAGAFAVAADAAGGGDYRCEEAPTARKRGHDVFGSPNDALPILRALKTRFDPTGVLNPGRFAGGL